MALSYAGGDKLYVPVENIDVLSRYGGAGDTATLDRLGGEAWQRRKARMKERIREIAGELIKTAAIRATRPGQVAKPTSPPTRNSSIASLKRPTTRTGRLPRCWRTLSGKPMDRLVCGDVGFGKTEVALRAAFIAAMAGYQVALICPTTLLTRQHYRNFVDRFHGFPIEIGRLSRLVPAAEAKATGKELKTARSTSSSALMRCCRNHQVQEARPGDCRRGAAFRGCPQREAQGAEGGRPCPHPDGHADPAHPANGHVGTARAVGDPDPAGRPAGCQDLCRSVGRGGHARSAAARTLSRRSELPRRPRIADLPDLEEWLREEVPEVKAVTAHGQMGAGEVEERIGAFYDKKYDVLLSTTIVESGLDIPSANADRPPRRPVRPGPALPAADARPVEDPRLCLSDDDSDRSLTEGADKRLQVLANLDSLGPASNWRATTSTSAGRESAGRRAIRPHQGSRFELYQSMLEDAIWS